MADAIFQSQVHSLPPSQIMILAVQPVLANRTENVQVQGVFERHSAMRHVRGDAQHLSGGDHHALPFEFEF